jgi:hypothetical protein
LKVLAENISMKLLCWLRFGKEKESLLLKPLRNINFKQILTKGKPKNTNSEKLWEYKKSKYFGIAFVIVGSLFLYGFWNIYSNREKVILPLICHKAANSAHQKSQTF